jgi:PAS domain S-box-containing protein
VALGNSSGISLSEAARPLEKLRMARTSHKTDHGVAGALTVYSSAPQAFNEHEIGRPKAFADILAYGIGSMRARADRERAETESQRLENRYRTLLEAINDGVLVVDDNLTITFVNPQFARLLGHPESGILGRRSIEFLDEAGQRLISERFERRKAGIAERYELNWVRSDGAVVPSLVSVQPIFDREHRCAGSISVVSDLSELNRARAMRDQLARIVESAQDGIIGEDLDGIVTSWNAGAERLFGYRAEEMIGRSIDALALPEGKGEFARLITRVRQSESLARYETQQVAKSGQRVDVAVMLSPVTDPAGRLVGVSTVAHDVTDLRRAERQAHEAARYARSLIEASLDPLVTISAEGRITDVNEAAVQATGSRREELVGSDFADYFSDPEQARSGNRAVFAQGSVRNYPLTLRHRSGATMDVLYNATLYRDAGGAVAGIFAAARDVTERKRAEEELRRHREHLEEMVAARTADLAQANAKFETANKELEAFAYSVSHDLRSPLRAIDGFSRMILEDYAGKLDAEGQRQLNVIRENAGKMARMIDDILGFSRVGRTEMLTETVDMAALVQETIRELEVATAGRKVDFELAPLPPALGDAAMMQRVWANLLGNAVKYTTPRPEARIQVGATPGNGENVYFVRDNGVGFDMQHAGKLFGVFQRLHGAEFPGTGIGLAIVKRVVTRHGGRVWAEGKPNEGATFYFALPAKGVSL